MARRWVQRNHDLKWSNHGDVCESEYDVVDDQEEMLDVCILPARPMYEETEYADRAFSGSSLAPGLSSLPAESCCRRPSPMTPGPAIKRELKPGRGKTRFDKKSLPPLPGGQNRQRSPPRIPPVPQGPVGGRPAPEDSCGRREQRLKNTRGLPDDFNSHLKGAQSTDRDSTTQFRQLEPMEWDTNNIEQRPQQWMESATPVWSPLAASEDHHGHIPDQRHNREEWYVGSCNRTDAEHALHLVNKDGAFLVRDCSIDTCSEPLVLVVYHEKKVYNVKIRFLKDTGKYALGMQQRSSSMFETVADIIKYHTIFPIMLVSGRAVTGSRYPENCLLTCPVTKGDVQQLLQ